MVKFKGLQGNRPSGVISKERLSSNSFESENLTVAYYTFMLAFASDSETSKGMGFIENEISLSHYVYFSTDGIYLWQFILVFHPEE